MLIEFRVNNHRSFHDEQAITMAASRVGDAADVRPRVVAGSDESLLPVAAIYGANASGKTNLLSAIAFMRDAVVSSHRLWEPDTGVPRVPFAWDSKKSESSLFEATFLIDETKFQYGFAASDEAIEEEWLFAWPNGRRQVWFERDGANFKFGDHLRGENKLIVEITRENALYLSAAAQNKHEQLMPIWHWFRQMQTNSVRGSHAGPRGVIPLAFTVARLVEALSSPDTGTGADAGVDSSHATGVRDLLMAADIGVVDIRIERESSEVREGAGIIRRPQIMLQHAPAKEDSWLPLEEESQGTKTLLRIGGPVVDALRKGSVLLVDELEASLHPLLGIQIVDLFNNPSTNPNNAQLLFTTHDTNLLGTTVGEPALRRDQIWFAEKSREGASVIYPLTEFKPRKAENIERGYLQGRYSAIPFLANFASIFEDGYDAP